MSYSERNQRQSGPCEVFRTLTGRVYKASRKGGGLEPLLGNRRAVVSQGWVSTRRIRRCAVPLISWVCE